jgi:hypothetical protein
LQDAQIAALAKVQADPMAATPLVQVHGSGFASKKTALALQTPEVSSQPVLQLAHIA